MPKKKYKPKEKQEIELNILSIITDKSDHMWLQARLLQSTDYNLQLNISKFVNTFDISPIVYLDAQNKLIRKYYSMCSSNKFFRLKFNIKDYVISNESTHLMYVLAYPFDFEVTIVPDIHKD